MNDLDVFLGKAPPKKKTGGIVSADERFERFKGSDHDRNQTPSSQVRVTHGVVSNSWRAEIQETELLNPTVRRLKVGASQP